MLIIPKFNNTQQWEKYIINDRGILIAEGILGLNLNNFVYEPRASFEQEYGIEEFTNYEISGYGIADNIDQILKYYEKLINSSNCKISIDACPIRKKDQPYEGGWRWHKWGQYIGIKNPKSEYLYDEDESIEEVYVFSCYLWEGYKVNHLDSVVQRLPAST